MFNVPLAQAYPAIFHKESSGGYFIEFPDIQGAYTGINNDNVPYAIAMAQEALGLVLSDYIEENDPLPIATPINDIEHDANDFVTLISVDVEPFLKDNSLVKKTLTIPVWANNLGNKAGINFSEVLTNAITERTIHSSGSNK